MVLARRVANQRVLVVHLLVPGVQVVVDVPMLVMQLALLSVLVVRVAPDVIILVRHVLIIVRDVATLAS